MMISRRRAFRSTLAAAAAVVLVSGCGMMPSQSNMMAFTTQLRGANEVPSVASVGSGQVDGGFNKDTNLRRGQRGYACVSCPAAAQDSSA